MKQSALSTRKLSLDTNTSKAYHLEKVLAQKLKNASREEREGLYNIVYEEYYNNFPQHPLIVKDKHVIERVTTLQMKYLKKYLYPEMVFVEIGPGSGALSIEVANYVNMVYAIDVSDSPLKNVILPHNMKLVISNGINMPRCIPSANLVYSSHVIEHLHPDDALEQLKDVYKVLSSGSIFICRTPHRYSGPHDISKHFDNISTCFHLKEYIVTELVELFKIAGFRNIRFEIIPKGTGINIPIYVINVIEKMIGGLPFPLKRTLTRNLPLRPLFNFSIVGTKYQN